MTYSVVVPPGLRQTVKSTEAKELLAWLERELVTLSRELVQEQDTCWLRPIYAEPEKPRAGMLVYADGTTWNPGSGQGVYRFNLAGTWSFVG